MDMPRCATCRHWENIWAIPEHKVQEEGGCALTMAETHPDTENEWWQFSHPESKARTIWFFPDDETFVRAMLVTEADFGCVLHEPKDGA